MMDSCSLKKALCFEGLLGSCSSQTWGETYPIIAKDAGRIVGSLYRYSKYLTHSVIHFLYKSQIKKRKNKRVFPTDECHMALATLSRLTWEVL